MPSFHGWLLLAVAAVCLQTAADAFQNNVCVFLHVSLLMSTCMNANDDALVQSLQTMIPHHTSSSNAVTTVLAVAAHNYCNITPDSTQRIQKVFILNLLSISIYKVN